MTQWSAIETLYSHVTVCTFSTVCKKGPDQTGSHKKKRQRHSVQWSNDYNLPVQASLCVKAVQTRVWNRLVISTVRTREELKYNRFYWFPNLLCLEMRLCTSGIHKVKASICRTRKGGMLNSRLHLRFRFPLIYLDYVLFVSSRWWPDTVT